MVFNNSTLNNWCNSNWCDKQWCVGYQTYQVPVQTTWYINNTYQTHMQTNWILYNTTNLRILWEIALDGIDDTSHTASSEVSPDKTVLNVKDDILEHYWQSTSNSNQWIVMDVGEGRTISIDTFAILNHNFTQSAAVTLKGSNESSPNWSTTDVFATIDPNPSPFDNKLIWVSPEAQVQQFRKWRVDIHDPTNPNEFLRVGRIVGGQALVLHGENILSQLKAGKKNYKEEIQLNGFTSIANNRTLKRYLELNISNLNVQTNSNHANLSRYVDYCRDTFKALVIPDPITPYKYSLYAKLTELPNEDVNYVDSENEYSSYSLSYDEGK